MTPAFITFTQKCSRNMMNEIFLSSDTILFTVDVAPVGRFPIQYKLTKITKRVKVEA